MSEQTPTNEQAPSAPAEAQAPSQETFDAAYVKTLREGEAKYRTERNAEREAHKKTKDDLATAMTALERLESSSASAAERATKAEHRLAQLEAAIAAEVPTQHLLTFSQLLQGDDPVAMQSHAENLKAMFGVAHQPQRAVDQSQGRNNSTPLNGDPLLEALKRAVKAV